MTLNISIDLSDFQEKGLLFATNRANKDKADSDKITPEQYALNSLVNTLNSYAADRVNIRVQRGIDLYRLADQSVKDSVDGQVGLSSEFPTGNE